MATIDPIRSFLPELLLANYSAPLPSQLNTGRPAFGMLQGNTGIAPGAVNIQERPGQSVSPAPMVMPIQPNTTPIAPAPQIRPQFTLQDMGQLPQPQRYPSVQPFPEPVVGPAPQQQMPEGQALSFDVPRETGGDALLGYKPEVPQEQIPGQASNALLYGLMAAGLGILANNYGKYGQAGPAIGAGGLVGLNTYLGQKQWEDQRAMRQQGLEQSAAHNAATEAYNNRLAVVQEQLANIQSEKSQRESDKQKRLETAREALSKAMDKFNSAKSPEDKMAADQGVNDALIRMAVEEGDADKVISALAKKQGGGGTQYERSFNTLIQLQLKKDQGIPLTPEEKLKEDAAKSIIGQTRYFVDPVTNQMVAAQGLQVPESMGGQGRTAPQVFGMPTEGGRKPLDAETEKELRGLGDARHIAQKIVTDFKDSYGGFIIDAAGQAAIAAGRALPDNMLPPGGRDLAQWWMEYANWRNAVLTGQFGSQLTVGETQRFKEATPKPGDNPETIRRALAIQMDILESKGKRRIDAIKSSGQNAQQAYDLFGGPPKTSGDMTGKPKRLRYNPETDKFEPIQ